MDAIGGGGGMTSVREPMDSGVEDAPVEEAAEPEASAETNETDSVDLGEEALGAEESPELGSDGEDALSDTDAESEGAAEEESALLQGLTDNYGSEGEGAEPLEASLTEPGPAPSASPISAAPTEPAPVEEAAAVDPGPAAPGPEAPVEPGPAPAAPAAAAPVEPGPAPAPAAAAPPAPAAPAPAQPAQKPLQLKPGELLERGDQGAKVRQLQEMLNRNGARLQTDGQLGPKTEAAIRDYQRKNGLATDGIVGPQTQGALNRGAQTPASQPAQAPANRPTQTPTNPAGTPAANPNGQPPRAPGSHPASDAARSWLNRSFKAGQTKRCADFVSTVLKQSGTAPPGFKHQESVAGLARYGTPVARKDLKPGDVLLFGNTYRPGPNTHTGIYVGNGQFVHRPTHNAPVKLDSLNGRYGSARHYGGARRMTP